MLHGAASDKTAWLRLAGCLRVALPLVASDLPGHGDSSFDDALRYDIGTQAACAAFSRRWASSAPT